MLGSEDGAESQRIRVFLVDDNPLFLRTMRSLLESYSDVEVIGETNDGEAAVIGLSWDTRNYIVSAMRQAGAFEVLSKDQAAGNELYGTVQKAAALKRRSDEVQP
jgi:DNA-binding NarL/FixJ family response regulator